MNRPLVREGLFPWLPWPLRAMPAWTVPVRAERLAVLRIGLGLFLLLDVLTSYWPNRAILFGPDSLGTLENYNWYAESGRRWWSLLRGPGNDLNFTLSFFIALGLTVWLVIDTRTRWLGAERRPPRPSPWLLAAWCFFCAYALAGFWVRVLTTKDLAPDSDVRLWMWIMPLLLTILAALLWAVEAWVAYHDAGRAADASLRQDRDEGRDEGRGESAGASGGASRGYLYAWYAAAWGFFPLLVVGGFLLHLQDWQAAAPTPLVRRLLEPWLLSHTLIAACMIVWIVALVFMILGFLTRPAILIAWALSTSFANVQPNIDNAGDTIRGILLFYLMICPCAAVWSIDDLFQRSRRPPGAAVVVSPWPICLLFMQLVFVYFINGMSKIFSVYWREGTTLYYVLHDLTLTRFSYGELPLNLWMTKALTWTVLIWELTFPLLVIWKPIRILALIFGAGFHIGIGLSMDLGFFVPYALCFYLPLLPWEWLVDRGWRRGAVVEGEKAPRAAVVDG